MLAQLINLGHFSFVFLLHVKFQKLQKAISVLGSELNRKIEVYFCFFQTKVPILGNFGHHEPCAFTPNFSWLRYFLQSLFKGVEALVEILSRFRSCVLQLDQSSPKSTCSKKGVEWLLNHLFRSCKAPNAHFEHYCLKMSFPFALRKLLCLAHDLSCSCHFVSHFKVFCVLN